MNKRGVMREGELKPSARATAPRLVAPTTVPTRGRFTTLRVPKAPELVAQSIRSQIVRRALQEGDTLPPESELMAQFGVSRPTLREALRVLESEGLISVQRGSRVGPRIRVPTAKIAARYGGLLLEVNGATIEDVFAARSILETSAIRQLAERPPRLKLRKLRALLEAEERVIDNVDAFTVLAQRFHSELIEATESRSLTLLDGMIAEIVSKAATSNAGETNRPRARRARAHLEHVEVLDLIEAGEVDRAEELWRDHLNVVTRNVTKRIGSQKVLDLLD
jgi:DNA-binding FadR family transcriptional regulator